MSPATVFDIDGIEYYVINSKYSKKFEIELYYGRIDEKVRKKPALILTEALKIMLNENETLATSKFGEFLSDTTINKLRRRLKQNPYKSFKEWAESTDFDKPQEIRFTNTREKLEIFTDYFGIKYILSSARIAKNGIILLLGISVEQYKFKHKYGNKLIVTDELADFLKKHRFHPSSVIDELSISLQTSKQIRKELGYIKSPQEEVNMWLAAHLVPITSMTKDQFITQYMKKIELGQGSVIRNLKNGLYVLKDFSKSTEKEKRNLFRIVRMLDSKSATDIIKRLDNFMHHEKARRCVKAYQILLLAREYNHSIPQGYKGILKKKKLQ